MPLSVTRRDKIHEGVSRVSREILGGVGRRGSFFESVGENVSFYFYIFYVHFAQC